MICKGAFNTNADRAAYFKRYWILTCFVCELVCSGLDFGR